MLSCLQFQMLTKSAREPGVRVSSNNKTIAVFIRPSQLDHGVYGQLPNLS